MKNLYGGIISGREKIAVTGLGYVGLPLAVAFSEKAEVIGFDMNENKIKRYLSGEDVTQELGDKAVAECRIDFTSDETRLKEAKFHVVAVPTPINRDTTPNLFSVEEASRTVGRNLTKGSIVVYESTVYPGVTEDICIPILEKESGLRCGIDFKVGYSPERINPGDKVHTLRTITKVVSGMDEETLETVAKVYELVVEAGVYKAESIKVAEAAKVIENSQRDINIAFMNELSMIFNEMGIDTRQVLNAAATKWNFLKFHPGLVGGHCIGVDPYYLTYKAEQEGYHSKIILAGRKVNDGMSRYVAENVVKKLIEADKNVKGAKVAILGFTFKDNCPDVRNTRVIEVVRELEEYGISCMVADPQADAEAAEKQYGMKFAALPEISGADAVILAVAHDPIRNLDIADFDKMYGEGRKVLLDLRAVTDKEKFEKEGYIYWRM